MKGLRRKNVNPSAAEIQLLKAGQEDGDEDGEDDDDDDDARIERAKSKVGLPSGACFLLVYFAFCFFVLHTKRTCSPTHSCTRKHPSR